MADEDKEKAEKLAAAKKRFEQLKKEQQKKSKKGGATKKKDDKATEAAKTEDVASTDDAAAESAPPIEDEKTEADENAATEEPSRPAAIRKMSTSVQSKQRSESFRQGSAPMSPGLEVQDLYRKQATRIEELEKENAAFKEQQDEGAARLAKAEEELDGLREGSGDMAELKTQAKEAERLQTELVSTQRQLAQAQQAANGAQRRESTTGPNLIEQLSSKTSTIEALELEISNQRNQMNGLQTTLSEREASTKELEDRATSAETATESAKQELDALKVSISFPSDDTKAASEDPEALTKRITVLESDLRTANADADAAAQRATSLEQKIEALTKLHRDATATSQAKDRELTDLRSQLKRRDRPSHVRDASEFELGEEETETGALQTRIRALEAENFDLRRGVWRDKRAELQPGIHDPDTGGPSPEYEDVDLNGPYTPYSGRKGSGQRQAHSTFQDVITSGISAFTGRTVQAQAPASGRARGGTQHSVGLLSEDDDDDFDPEAFRLAQEEEARRRVERVREIKRGLDEWRGWRVDIADLRKAGRGVGGAREFGAVFEV
ncbi:hypothetical protein LTR37_002534 [Vermiconidia calcicola]|uniref:Uncharacterized protein n=1 Tax=Vermiconidia calcicola TaxID=1690605 RepID=A0ACC3NT76_9PEZI|nr:hypothetical protein LTR37_002534 [Vermiconidia calcicola]